jgi:hypothetical protein
MLRISAEANNGEPYQRLLRSPYKTRKRLAGFFNGFYYSTLFEKTKETKKIYKATNAMTRHASVNIFPAKNYPPQWKNSKAQKNSTKILPSQDYPMRRMWIF